MGVHTDKPDYWQRAIIFTFHLLFLTVPLVFTWVNEELFEFNKILLVYAYTVIILGLWCCRMITQQRFFVRRSIFDWPILLFVISQVLSTIFSIHPHTSIFGYYTRFNGGLLSVLSYVSLFYAFITNVPKNQIKKLIITLFAAALLVSLYAIPEHFGHSPSCLLINTSQHRGSGNVFSSEWFNTVFNDACWIQDVQSRVFGTFGQPNWLAAYAILLIPVGFVLSGHALEENAEKPRLKDLLLRGFFGFTSILLFETLIFTKSRSGMLGFATESLFLICGILFFSIRRKSLRLISMTTFLFSIAVISAFTLTALYFGTPYTPSVGEIFHKPDPTPVAVTSPSATASPMNRLDIGGTESAEIRRIVWTGAFRVWERYPIFGSGVETFAYSYYKDRPVEHNLVSEWDFLYNKAHNEFLNYLATTGIVGFSTYVVMLGFFIVMPVWISRNASNPFISLSISASLIGLSVSNLLGFSTVMVSALFFLYPAFVVVLYGKEHLIEFKGENAAENETDTGLAMIGFAVVGIVVVILLYSTFSMWTADHDYAYGKALIQAGQLVKGVENLRKAAAKSPNEGLFDEELGITYARVAVETANDDATSAAQLANQAIEASDQMMQLNPVNLNFYKSRVKVLMNLSQLQPLLLYKTKDTLNQAIELSPTDPKLRYFLGLVELGLDDKTGGVENLEKSIELKPDYEQPRLSLAQEFVAEHRNKQAIEQYQYILDKIAPSDETAKKALDILLHSPVQPQKKV